MGGPAGSRPERRARLDPREVASHLAPSVRWPGALDMRRRSWRLMARTRDFDAWLIAWPKGGKVELHDTANPAER